MGRSMTPHPIPPFEPVVFVISLSWAVISAAILAHSIRMEDQTTKPWFWALSFVGASMVAGVFFWRLVGGAA